MRRENRMLLLVISILLNLCQALETFESTACFGSQGLPCTTHHINCTSSLVIRITDTSYGYRSSCNDTTARSNCIVTECCQERPGDCFIPFSNREYNDVCSDKTTCTIAAKRHNTDQPVCGNQTVSVYSKIEYRCVELDINNTTNVSSTTIAMVTTPDLTSPKVTKAYTGTVTTTKLSSTSSTTIITSDSSTAVVGGVLGSLLGISIIIIVGLIIYFKRKIKTLVTKEQHTQHYYSPHNTGDDPPQPSYDSLNTNDGPSYYNLDTIKNQASNNSKVYSNLNSQRSNSTNDKDMELYCNTNNEAQGPIPSCGATSGEYYDPGVADTSVYVNYTNDKNKMHY